MVKIVVPSLKQTILTGVGGVGAGYVQILPPNTPAINFNPSLFDATLYQSRPEVVLFSLHPA